MLAEKRDVEKSRRASVTGMMGIFSTNGGDIDLRLSTASPLPRNFPSEGGLELLAANGRQLLFQAQSLSVPREFALFTQGGEGELTWLTQTGEGHDSMAQGFQSCLFAEAKQARFFLLVTSRDLERQLVEMQGERLQPLISPGAVCENSNRSFPGIPSARTSGPRSFLATPIASGMTCRPQNQ